MNHTDHSDILRGQNAFYVEANGSLHVRGTLLEGIKDQVELGMYLVQNKGGADRQDWTDHLHSMTREIMPRFGRTPVDRKETETETGIRKRGMSMLYQSRVIV